MTKEEDQLIEADKVRENRVRWILARRDLRLAKRRLDPNALGYGFYVVVDGDDAVAIGVSSTDRDDYFVTLEDIKGMAPPPRQPSATTSARAQFQLTAAPIRRMK